MRFRPANIRLINRRSKLLRLLLALSSGKEKQRQRQKQPHCCAELTRSLHIRPPMTARPFGAFCSPPSPRISAMGSMPIIIASAVMHTGRSRVVAGNQRRLPCILFGLTLAAGFVREAHHEDAIRSGNTDGHQRPHE